MNNGEMESGPGLGSRLTVEEYNELSEVEKFAWARVGMGAVAHLEIASKEADTILERTRSVFGVYNLKKNFEVAKKVYERHTRNNL